MKRLPGTSTWLCAVTAQFSSTNLKEECSSMNLAQNHSINSLKTTEKKTSGSLGYWTSTTDMGTQSYSFTVYALWKDTVPGPPQFILTQLGSLGRQAWNKCTEARTWKEMSSATMNWHTHNHAYTYHTSICARYIDIILHLYIHIYYIITSICACVRLYVSLSLSLSVSACVWSINVSPAWMWLDDLRRVDEARNAKDGHLEVWSTTTLVVGGGFKQVINW